VTAVLIGVVAWLAVLGFAISLVAISRPTPEQREAIRRAREEWSK
jgi:hypothetical protein